MKTEITGTIEINEVEIDFAAEVTYEIGNNGIGAYEFWGQKCYDRGHDYIENIILEKVIVDKNIIIDKDILFTAVEKYIEKNFDSISEEISVKIAEQKMDYREED